MENELRKELRELDDRLDKHIEMYQKNGRELVRLSLLIEEHTQKDDERWIEIKPVVDYWNGFKYGKRFIIGAIGFFTAIGGAIIIWKQIK